VAALWRRRGRHEILASLTPEERATDPLKPAWEYRSAWTFLGLPLLHIRHGERMAGPTRGWISVGDCAVGGLIAFGGLAIAPISIGGCAIGLIAFGGTAIGALALGGLGLGIWSFGGLAIGWQAFGGCAVAWNAALGGVSIAREYALGGLVHAAQANNVAAQSYVFGNWFFQFGQMVARHAILINLIWVTPLMAWWWAASRGRRQR